MSRGVIVGCDQAQEWLLEWWWHGYRRHNGYPVAFVDFGMSEEARAWCERKGKVVALDSSSDFVLPRTFVGKELAADWEKAYGPGVWKEREHWLRKPLAMTHSPFEETVWLDLDCEVAGPLSSLFSKIHTQCGIALSPDRDPLAEESSYNTGVVVFQRESPLLARWADCCRRMNDRFVSDRDILSFLINGDNIEVTELSESYNWRFEYGVNLEASIFHWSGVWGKSAIKRSLFSSVK